jgi:hypothetical protein
MFVIAIVMARPEGGGESQPSGDAPLADAFSCPVSGAIELPDSPMSPETVLKIQIKEEDFQQISAKRAEAIDINRLVTGADDYVPATIRHDGKKLKAKIRLKGDLVDHLTLGCKWSYRVKLKGDTTVLGMKIFSLQHPKTRGYMYEWLYHELLKNQGVIGLRYLFMNVYLNDTYLGIFALEEHFEKRLIESNRLREGPILRFDEGSFWENKQRSGTARKDDETVFLTTDIDTFRRAKLASSPTQLQYFEKGQSLLDAFRHRTLAVSDVFDVRKLASYYATTFVMSGVHALRWHNPRFYYNPVTSLIEPIGFDAFDAKKADDFKLAELDFRGMNRNKGLFDYWSYDVYNRLIFSDPLFFEELVTALEQITEPQVLDDFFAEVEDQLQTNSESLAPEFPSLRFSNKPFYKNQKYIRDVLRRYKELKVYLVRRHDAGVEIVANNVGALPVELLGLVEDGNKHDLEGERIVYSTKQLPPNTRVLQSPYRWKDVSHKVYAEYRVLGSRQIKRTRVLTEAPEVISDLTAAARKQQADRPRVDPDPQPDLVRAVWSPTRLSELEWVEVDAQRREIRILPGTWNVESDVVFPSGYRVICREGTTLKLGKEVNLISHSALDFRGSSEEPIRIIAGQDGAQGLVVLQAQHRSVLDYVMFAGLSPPNKFSYLVTGAVTFYESDVVIRNSRFDNLLAEDSLNVIRSNYSIESTVFSGAPSDALDADFAEGVIRNSSFENIDGDAIDISDGHAKVVDVRITDVGDKGISAGEAGTVVVSRVQIVNAPIGIASKDLSRVTVDDVSISRAIVGLTAYQKKTEFGPGYLEVTGFNSRHNQMPYLVESGSVIMVDGVEVIGFSKAKQSELFRRMKGGVALD